MLFTQAPTEPAPMPKPVNVNAVPFAQRQQRQRGTRENRRHTMQPQRQPQPHQPALQLQPQPQMQPPPQPETQQAQPQQSQPQRQARPQPLPPQRVSPPQPQPQELPPQPEPPQQLPELPPPPLVAASASESSAAPAQADDNNLMDCQICAETLPNESFGVSKACTHLPVACDACRRRDIVEQMRSNTSSLYCRLAPPHQCVIGYSCARALAGAEHRNEFERWYARTRGETEQVAAEVRKHGQAIWCAAGCGALLAVGGASVVQCTDKHCNVRTCVTHERRAARPSPESVCCDGALAEQRRHELAASEQLVATTTRPCPRCNVATVRDGGCFHMTCTQCQHEYYWCCGRAYRDRDQSRTLA